MTTHQINSTSSTKGGFGLDGEWDNDLRSPKFETEVRIDSGRGYPHRFGVGLVPAGQKARKTQGGPLVEGPWGFTFGLATVLSASPMPEAPSINAEWGDIIVLDGHPFTIDPIVRMGRKDERWADLNPTNIARDAATAQRAVDHTFGEHEAVIDVDCAACRADAEALGMTLPGTGAEDVQRDRDIEQAANGSFDNGVRSLAEDVCRALDVRLNAARLGSAQSVTDTGKAVYAAEAAAYREAIRIVERESGYFLDSAGHFTKAAAR